MNVGLHNNDDFDNFFKKKYVNDAINPSPDLWENIHKDIKYNKININYKNITLLKTAVAFLVVALIGTITFFELRITSVNKNQSDNNNSNTEQTNKNTNSNPKQEKNDQTISGWNKTVYQEETTIKNNLKPIEYKTNKKQNSNSLKTVISTKSIKKEATVMSKTEEKRPMPKISSPVSEEEQYITTSKEEQPKFTNQKLDNLSKTPFIETKKVKETDKEMDVAQQKISTSIKQTKISGNAPNKQEKQIVVTKASKQSNILDTSKVIKKKEKRQVVQSGEQTNIPDTSSVKEIATKEKLVQDSITTKRKNPIDFKSFLNKFSLGLCFTPQYSFRKLYDNQTVYNPDLGINYYNNREKGDFGFKVELQLYYFINNKWNIRTGIDYWQYTQKIEVSKFDLVNISHNQYLINTSVGDNILTIRSSTPIAKADLFKSSLVYSYINVPLIIEYNFSKNMFISGGINYNILIDKSIDWEAENYTGDFSITTEDISGVESSNLSLSLGAGYQRTIIPNLQAYISPQFTYFATSLSKQLPVNSYPYTFGLKIGLKYNFNH
jgi:hypothetical protein